MYTFVIYTYKYVSLLSDLVDIITGQGYKFMLPFNVNNYYFMVL